MSFNLDIPTYSNLFISLLESIIVLANLIFEYKYYVGEYYKIIVNKLSSLFDEFIFNKPLF